MSTQDNYTNTIRQSQEAWTGALETITQNVQNAFGQSGKSFGVTDPNAAIDQVFDFWKQTLESQREIAKQLIGLSVAAGQKVREQTESVGTAIREQAESAGTAIREQSESVARASREQAEAAEKAERDRAAQKYEPLTKEALQDELGRRNLPKTGNVDELRDRLIEDDNKKK